MPIAGLIGMFAVGELIWLSFGSTSATYSPDSGFCANGAELLLFAGIALWLGAIAGSLRITRERSKGARVLLGIWNAALTAPLVMFVFLRFVLGVAACAE
jgi:hypothetical protein